MHSGSGTLLRYASALATLTRKPLHIFNIRAKRDKPGLRPQHLMALRACCALSAGRIEGDQIGSQEIKYWPGNDIKGGSFHWDIGTAGSATMLAFTLIPPALYAETACHFAITGGLFQDFAPTAYHMQYVLIPTVRRMGANVGIEVIRPGYVPKGGGCLHVTVKPLSIALKPYRIAEQGKILEISGIALASHLKRERVSERMADRCRKILAGNGFQANIEIRHDSSAIQRGAALTLWARTDRGCILGSDQAGKRGRRSESIAEFVCKTLIEDLQSNAATDRYLADQLILFAALGDGTTKYSIPTFTEHVQSNLWLVKEILDVESRLDGNRLAIDGTGLRRLQ